MSGSASERAEWPASGGEPGAGRPGVPGDPGSGPEELDCAQALARVSLFLDHEMDEADCVQVQRHLDDCAPCLQKYDLEGLVKVLVARSCACEHAPEQLREKVLLRIRQVHVEISRRRSS